MLSNSGLPATGRCVREQISCRGCKVPQRCFPLNLDDNELQQLCGLGPVELTAGECAESA